MAAPAMPVPAKLVAAMPEVAMPGAAMSGADVPVPVPVPAIVRPDVNGEVEARLSRLERHVAAQAAALQRAPRSMPVPRSVTALLATAPAALGDITLPARDRGRVVKLLDQVQVMIDELTLRKHELGGRIATVRAAGRAGPAAHTLDYES
jgi:hypothetical protein